MNSEPQILAFGRGHIRDYGQSMFETCFTRLFEINNQEEVFLTSNINGQDFMAAAVAWGVDCGLLFNSKNENEKRESVHYFKLTESGKKKFLVNQSASEFFPKTRAEKELEHWGATCFKRDQHSVILLYKGLKFQFDCDCPCYPIARSHNCPIHHEGVLSYGPITEANNLIGALKSVNEPDFF